MFTFVDRLLLLCSSVIRFLVNLFSLMRFPFSPQSVHINSLPEECLLAIFDRIPLSDLMRLDQVCHQWAMLLSSATSRRHTLVLIIGGYEVKQIRFIIPLNDDFEISHDGHQEYYNLPVPERETSLTLPFFVPKSLDEFILSKIELTGFFDILYHTTLGGHAEANFTEMARLNHARLTGQLRTYFVGQFPNVNTLIVIHPECFEAELQSVIDLLASWPLVNLKLWLHTDERYEGLLDQHPVGNLLRSINNQQHSLQQLTLNIEGVGNAKVMKFTFPVEYYSFIAQLKVAKIYLGSYDLNNSIWRTVHRFDSTKLGHICLGNRDDFIANSALKPQFTYVHKVRQLYDYRCFESVEQLNIMCLRFNSLTMLEIYWQPNITFTELVAKLASLRHLTYLNLWIYFEDHPENAFALVDQVADDQEEPRPISLPQVKILEFFIEKHTHQDFESFSPNVFPSVETILVDNLRVTPPVTECIICRPNMNGPFFLEMANLCDLLLFHSLKNKFTANPAVRIYLPYLNLPFPDENEKIILLFLSLMLLIFPAYKWFNDFSKANIVIYSNNTDQNLKQRLADVKFCIGLTYTFWNLVRFVCLAYITLQNDNFQVENRKITILNVLKLGSYTIALLLSLVTGLVCYYLINVLSLISPSGKAHFRHTGQVYILVMMVLSSVELLLGLLLAMINAFDNGIYSVECRFFQMIMKLYSFVNPN